jgi:hypothetical protein
MRAEAFCRSVSPLNIEQISFGRALNFCSSKQKNQQSKGIGCAGAARTSRVAVPTDSLFALVLAGVIVDGEEGSKPNRFSLCVACGVLSPANAAADIVIIRSSRTASL